MAVATRARENILLPGLRAATAVAHQQIERQPNMARLMASDLELHEYARVLLGFTLFFRKLEPQIIAQLNTYKSDTRNDNCHYVYEPRLPLLATDLEIVNNRMIHEHGESALNIDFIQNLFLKEPAQSLIDDIVWPTISNQWQLLGALYVLEGSSQGGKVLAPRINRTLALNRDGCNYFNIWEKPTNSWIQWQEWCKQVEQNESGPIIAKYSQQVYATAVQTFNAISECMETISVSIENQ